MIYDDSPFGTGGFSIGNCNKKPWAGQFVKGIWGTMWG